MDLAEFRAEFTQTARVNGLYPPRVTAMIGLIFDNEPDADFHNVFRGGDHREYLVVTGQATYALRAALLGPRLLWVVHHGDLDSDAYHRRGTSLGHVVDDLILTYQRTITSFRFGCHDPRAPAAGEVARGNAEVAARQINAARESAALLWFDPEGPEKAAAAARQAYAEAAFERACYSSGFCGSICAGRRSGLAGRAGRGWLRVGAGKLAT